MISILLIFLLISFNRPIIGEPSSDDSKCFRAAVYEHIDVGAQQPLAINQPTDQPLKILNNNLLIYERVVKRASFIDAKIIVFPEYSFLAPLARDQLLSGGVVPFVPIDLNVNLCSIYKEKFKNITQSPINNIQKSERIQLLDKETRQINDKVLVNRVILRKLSCLAQDNHIYLAANLITIENKNNLNRSPSSSSSTEEDESSELDTLKQSDQLINDKLTDQLNKINKEQNQIGKYEDYLLFNTEIVFDNQGRLIAKYHKYNLFNEKSINRTALELVTFNSPFGRFGLATSQDVLFEEPIKSLVEKEKIDHLIMPTQWTNDLPSLTNFNIQSAAATKYKVNILGAGKRKLNEGVFGSGIYNGKLGVRLQTSFDNHDRLLVADLPIGSLNNANDDSSISANEQIDSETMEYSNLDVLDSNGKIIDVNSIDRGKCSHFEPVRVTEETYQENSYVFKDNTFLSSFKPLQVPFDLYTTKRIESTEGKIMDLCDKGVCCEIEWKMNDKLNFVSDNYFLAVVSRLKESVDPKISFYEENCALISYHQSQPQYKIVASTHFDKLILRGKFNTTEIYPTVLSSALYLVPRHKWNFKQLYNEAELSFNNVKRPILYVSLYGRVYDKDQIVRD